MIIIRPPHDVRDRKHLRRLCNHMSEHGWQGRPLLVEKIPGEKDTYQAWTGSHRITAAEMVGLQRIPLYVMNDKLIHIRRGRDGSLWSSPDLNKSNDRDRYALLVKSGERKAAGLVQEEIMMNQRELDTGSIDPSDSRGLR